MTNPTLGDIAVCCIIFVASVRVSMGRAKVTGIGGLGGSALSNLSSRLVCFSVRFRFGFGFGFRFAFGFGFGFDSDLDSVLRLFWLVLV